MTEIMADISNYQGVVDLTAYKNGGHSIIALKATEGKTYIDPPYVERVKAAHDLGLKVVHYHFGHNVGEWGHYWSVVGPNYFAGDVVCLDAEAATITQAVVDDFFTMAATGEKWLYTGKYVGVHSPPGVKLWLAAYVSRATRDLYIPTGDSVGNLIAWQFTDAYTFAGIGTPCDASEYYPAATPPPVPPTLPSANRYAGFPTIKLGSKDGPSCSGLENRGCPVTSLQNALNIIGRNEQPGSFGHLTPDGVFGQQTDTVLRNFQRFFHLTVDGICGPMTWRTLDIMLDLMGR